MKLFSFLKNPEPISHSDLGVLKYSHSEWEGKLSLPPGEVGLAIHGNKKAPDQFARDYAVTIRCQIPELWVAAKEFSREKLTEWGWEYEIDTADFQLSTVAVHKRNSFDGGHLSFWFSFRPDEDGSYYVSFRDEKPFHFHRDS